MLDLEDKVLLFRRLKNIEFAVATTPNEQESALLDDNLLGVKIREVACMFHF